LGLPTASLIRIIGLYRWPPLIQINEGLLYCVLGRTI
jgi:hypothetical protein